MTGMSPPDAIPAIAFTLVALLLMVAVQWQPRPADFLVPYERYCLRLIFAAIALNSGTAALFYLGIIHYDVRAIAAAFSRVMGSLGGLYLAYRWWRLR